MINRPLSRQLISFRERLTKKFLFELTKLNPSCENLSENELNEYNLIRKDDFNASVLAHKFLMQKLFEFAIQRFLPDISVKNLCLDCLSFTTEEKINLHFLEGEDKNVLIQLLEFLHTDFLNSEITYENGELKRAKSKINLKETGAVYTQVEIAEQITGQTIQNCVLQNAASENLKILDFGCGTGRFYFSALRILNEKFGIPKNEAVKNLYAIDSDKIALTILKLKALFETGIKNSEVINRNVIHRNMLVLNNKLDFGENNFADYQKDFAEV